MAGADEKPTPRPVALQLYTLRQEADADLAGVLARVAEIGYVGLEPFAVAKHGAARLRRLADQVGLQFCSAHMPLPSGPEAGRILDDLAELGTDVIFVSGKRDQFSSKEGVERLAEAFSAGVEAAAARGVRVGYHNHWWEFSNSFDGQVAYDYFLASLGAEVPLEVDTYWVQAGGADPAATVGRLGARVSHLHVKDGPAVPGEAQVAVGEGKVDVAGVLGANEAVAWHIVELDSCEGDTFEVVRASYDYLVSAGLSSGNRAPGTRGLPR